MSLRACNVLTTPTITYTHRWTQAVEALHLSVASVDAQARTCNERKLAAKSAQERSDEVYLCVYLARVGGVEVDAVVSDVGGTDKAFSILVPMWGLEFRVFLDRCGWVGRIVANGRALHVDVAPAPVAPAAVAVHNTAETRQPGDVRARRHGRGELTNTVRRKIGKWLKRHPDEKARLDAGEITMDDLVARFKAIVAQQQSADAGEDDAGDDGVTTDEPTGGGTGDDTSGAVDAPCADDEVAATLGELDDRVLSAALTSATGPAVETATEPAPSAPTAATPLLPMVATPQQPAGAPGGDSVGASDEEGVAAPATQPDSAASAPLPPGGVTLQHLSRLRVRLTASTGRVPIDVDVVVLAVLP